MILGLVKGTERLAELWQAQDGKCFYCEREMRPMRGAQQHGRSIRSGWSEDHFVPKHAGGSGKETNIVLSHLSCNNRKGGRLPTAEEAEKFRRIFGRAPDPIPSKQETP